MVAISRTVEFHCGSLSKIQAIDPEHTCGKMCSPDGKQHTVTRSSGNTVIVNDHVIDGVAGAVLAPMIAVPVLLGTGAILAGVGVMVGGILTTVAAGLAAPVALPALALYGFFQQ